MSALLKGIKRGRWGYLFISPWVLLYAVFGVYPLVLSFYLTFFNYNFVQPRQLEFVGISNWLRGLSDPNFWRSLFNVVYNQAIFITLTLGLGILVAVLIKEVRWGTRFFRTVFFTPTIVSIVVVMIIGNYFAGPIGPIQALLVDSGVLDRAVFWTSSRWLAMPVLALINSWKWFGISMVILLAGLYTIDPQYYEAAELDGASRWTMFWKITLPLLNPQIFFLLVLDVINGLQMFTEVYMNFDVTGGLYGQGLTPVLYLYGTAFNRSNVGYASTIGLLLALLIAIFTVLQFRFLQRDVD
jgi:ABC-type sugar transport system permease subunit